MPNPAARPHLAAADRTGAGGRLGVAVVLDHEDRRQLPDLREVVAFEASCPGWSRRRRRSRPPRRRSSAVFAVSAAPQTSGGPPPTMPLAPSMPFERSAMCIEPPLPPHSPSLRPKISCIMASSVAALGDAMAVAAMGGGDDVALVEMQAHADAGGLLAGIEMHEARNASRRELVVHRVLEVPDRPHLTIRPRKLLARQLHRTRHLSSSLSAVIPREGNTDAARTGTRRTLPPRIHREAALRTLCHRIADGSPLKAGGGDDRRRGPRRRGVGGASAEDAAVGLAFAVAAAEL